MQVLFLKDKQSKKKDFLDMIKPPANLIYTVSDIVWKGDIFATRSFDSEITSIISGKSALPPLSSITIINYTL